MNEHIIQFGQSQIGYCEYGDPSGKPIIYCHGGQESRLSALFLDETAKLLGIKLIAPDRPGFGLSTFQVKRRLLDWPKTIQHLADLLDLGRFSIFGLSGGAPHVLACAYSIPERLNKIAIVSGPAPYHVKGIMKNMWAPVRLMYWFASLNNDFFIKRAISYDYSSLIKNPQKRINQMKYGLPKPDRTLLENHPEIATNFLNGSLEGYREGIKGAVWEWQLYTKSWEFEPSSIHLPITLWYGDKDVMVPPYHGQYLHESIPNSELNLLPNEAHFSLIHNHKKAILEGLV